MYLNVSCFPILSQYNVLLVLSLDSRTNFLVKEIMGISKSYPRCSPLHLQEVQDQENLLTKLFKLIDR